MTDWEYLRTEEVEIVSDFEGVEIYDNFPGKATTPQANPFRKVSRVDRWTGEKHGREVRYYQLTPVKHYEGVCHVYVDDDADLRMAAEIAFNAKVQRPGVCNAMETLLVHAAVGEKFLPEICGRLADAGVELRGCERVCEIVPKVGAATEEDWYTEYLDLVLAVKVVDDMEAAVAHIAQYGSAHTDAIVTRDYFKARRFVMAVDSSSVMVNASTRLSDGGVYGLGAEIGISTDKLHARGPMGVEELTTYKWVVYGEGALRE